MQSKDSAVATINSSEEQAAVVVFGLKLFVEKGVAG